MPDNSFFGDLPEEGQEPKAQEQTEEQKQKEEEEIRQLKIAAKQEDRKLTKLEQAKLELAEKRKKAKDLKKEVDGGEDEPVEPEPVKPVEDVNTAVARALQERELQARKQRIADIIRQTAKTRAEAEEIFAQVGKSESTGDDHIDVKLAIDRVTALKSRSRGFSSPSFSGSADFGDMETRQPSEDGLSKESKEWLQAHGASVEDAKKFKHGPNLEGVWNQEKVIPFSLRKE